MIRYVVRRVALALVVVAGVVVLTFVIADVVPGDPAASWAGPHASAAQIARARHYLGLDQPLAVRIGRYFGGIVTGNWGTSIHTHRAVLSDLGTAAPATLELVIFALVIAVLVGIPLGLARRAVAGQPRRPRHPGRLGARRVHAGVLARPDPATGLRPATAAAAVAGQYDPNLIFSHPLVSRTQMPVVDALISGNWSMLGSTLQHLILPALVVAAYPAAVMARMVRAQVLDIAGEAHVQMVRSLGFPERTVFGTFAMRLAWNPVAAVLALVFAYSLVNTFLVESVFDWPGLGSYAAASVSTLDTPAIVGVTLFIAIVYVASNLVVDLLQAALDPRIRLR